MPELELWLADEITPIWRMTEEDLGRMGIPPPFWAFAWAGGQALARHVLDRPELVRGKSVIDLASGSGLVGIAALKAGADHVLCADIDGFAVVAIAMNTALNGIVLSPPPPRGEGLGVGGGWQLDSRTPTPAPPHKGEGRIGIMSEDLLIAPPPPCDVILVGDLFYEKYLAARVYDWLSQAEAHGITTLIGDPGRSYLPRGKLENLGEYKVKVTRDLEDAEFKWTSVWRLDRNC